MNLPSPRSPFPLLVFSAFVTLDLWKTGICFTFSFLYSGVQNFHFLHIIYKTIVFKNVLEQVAWNSYHSQRFHIKWDLTLLIFISRSYFLDFFEFTHEYYIYIIFPHLSFPPVAPSTPQIHDLFFNYYCYIYYCYMYIKYNLQSPFFKALLVCICF